MRALIYLYSIVANKPNFRMQYENGKVGRFRQTYSFQKWMLRSGYGSRIVLDNQEVRNNEM